MVSGVTTGSLTRVLVKLSASESRSVDDCPPNGPRNPCGFPNVVVLGN